MVEEMTEENGVKILTWVWNAGAIGVRTGEPLLSPEDVRGGNVTRAAGPRIEQMLEGVGFGLSSMPSQIGKRRSIGMPLLCGWAGGGAEACATGAGAEVGVG